MGITISRWSACVIISAVWTQRANLLWKEFWRNLILIRIWKESRTQLNSEYYKLDGTVIFCSWLKLNMTAFILRFTYFSQNSTLKYSGTSLSQTPPEIEKTFVPFLLSLENPHYCKSWPSTSRNNQWVYIILVHISLNNTKK